MPRILLATLVVLAAQVALIGQVMADYDCADFASHAGAQAYFDSRGGGTF